MVFGPSLFLAMSPETWWVIQSEEDDLIQNSEGLRNSSFYWVWAVFSLFWLFILTHVGISALPCTLHETKRQIFRD